MSKLTGKARQRANIKKKNKSKNSFFLYRKRLLAKIIKWDNPILKEVCSTVDSSEDISGLIKEMKDVLLVSDNGLGISASQIGISKKIFITRKDIDSKDIKVFVNAMIVSESSEKEKRGEGCLSYPGVVSVIERSSEITIEYEDENFSSKTDTFKGLDACVICHEYDHTFGICLVGDEWRKEKEEVDEPVSKDIE